MLQLIRVLHHLTSEGNCGRYMVAVLLDMEKIFDKMWHDGLIHKLLDTPLPPALISVVTGFLQRRSFCVAVDDVLSVPRPIRAGVPQGSYLSPELYIRTTHLRYAVKNNVIARDLGVETIEEFVRMLARRAFNRADAGPYPSLHNLAPHYDRPTKGYKLPRDLVSKSPKEGKV
ncbi:RNA-directed DNA polymerase from mobile element jockey [Eumeta japonica]|uniref:RNA-directed DNA polymerase from mobile element jockey n=1 Tax=Eumeta variegata TaxID=151549 RepID=A0A4C1YRI4_EUMVA|nr:RNA-directed DNA polymerase from mobile element jockey [Eumeta japonica]